MSLLETGSPALAGGAVLSLLAAGWVSGFRKHATHRPLRPAYPSPYAGKRPFGGTAMRGRRKKGAEKKPEAEYHDEFYASLNLSDEDLMVVTEGFRQSLHANPIGDLYACVLDKLGDYRGKKILDYGSGTGQIGVFFALTGAQVRGFDVSAKAVEVANRRAAVNGVASAARFEVMTAGDLQYGDETFDFAVGRWILHHLEKEELPRCGAELWRVLKKGAKAFFIEPLGHNPLIEWIRKHPFYSSGGYESDYESTMKTKEILAMGRLFEQTRVHEFHLLYMLKRVIRGRRILKVLKAADKILLRAFRPLKRFCGECVIEFVK